MHCMAPWKAKEKPRAESKKHQQQTTHIGEGEKQPKAENAKQRKSGAGEMFSPFLHCHSEKESTKPTETTQFGEKQACNTNGSGGCGEDPTSMYHNSQYYIRE